MEVNKIYNESCLDTLRRMPDEFVDCVVTSPPYYGLRDYGAEGQIGLEKTPSDYVAALVGVFAEIHRVLKKDATLWLNLGDSYAREGGKTAGVGRHWDGRKNAVEGMHDKKPLASEIGYKPKDLMMIPHRVAIALQEFGWWVRQDIVWHKPNPMPESVTDRCTKSHEYIFLLTKSDKYHFDNEAIKEKSTESNWQSRLDRKSLKSFPDEEKNGIRSDRPQRRRAFELAEQHGLTDEHIAAIRSVGITDTGKAQVTQSGFGKNTVQAMRLADEAKQALGGYYREFLIPTTRNKRSVWTIQTKPFKDAHFATFPPELPELCIKAGCKEGGTVYDPFSGAGTTALVAYKLGRQFIGSELNSDYCDIANKRLEPYLMQAGLF